MADRRGRGELRNELSWSNSRYGMFRECLRRYYYHYYGAWGGWAADADPGTRRLYILKNLKNRYLWCGSLVHDTVAGVLERVRAGVPWPNCADTAEAAIVRMRAEFRQSRDGEYERDPKGALGLVEHHYREAVSDEVWRQMAALVRRSIEGFFADPFLTTVRGLAADDWLALEDLQSLEIDRARVFVKMDLAFRTEEGATIVDWKTGRRKPQPEGLQLGTYALYASQTWQIPPAAIQLVEVNLSTREIGSARASADQLTQAGETIRAAIAAMRARLVDPQENIARIEEFPATVAARTCARCAFRECCPEYGEQLAPGAAAQLGRRR